MWLSAERRSRAIERLDLQPAISIDLLAFHVFARPLLPAIGHVVTARALALRVNTLTTGRVVAIGALLLLLPVPLMLAA